jgi:hypothetical protein
MRLAEEFRRQGHSVEVEKDGADLSLEKDRKRVAVEIETGKSNTEVNIDRDLEAGLDEVIVVWTERERKRDPMLLVAADLARGIRFRRRIPLKARTKTNRFVLTSKGQHVKPRSSLYSSGSLLPDKEFKERARLSILCFSQHLLA